jgi:hypothetical protein
VTAGRLGLGATGLGLGCFLLAALLGPSAVQPALGGGSGPPFALTAEPSPYLAIGLIAAGVILGAVGLGLGLHAARRGRLPAPRPLLIAGLLAVAAFALLPPIGSGDHLNYAGYGRMAMTGHDPYTTRAIDLPGDPVAGAAEEWRAAPSVYGPIATAQQVFASWIGGDSLRLTVFVLSVTNALAFAATGFLLYRMCRTRAGRLRAVLLWTLNPLMLFHLVAGAHNDALSIVAAVGALAAFALRTRRAFAAGILVGVAAAIKFPAALVGGGPAWTTLRRPRRLAALLGGAVPAAGTSYILAGSQAFDQVGRASNSISLASPWHLLDVALGVNQHRIVIRLGALALLLVLLWLLLKALPKAPPELRIAAALALAWLFTAPYQLPWYDGLGWALLALLPWSRYDWALLAHTTALSLAYLPARGPQVIALPANLDWLVTVVRSAVIPWVLTALLCWLVAVSLRQPAYDSPRP